ncbi:hypothetical protein KCP78_22475 [Salmonella enterica subsp. enterica]|nr:hypothetical protein KCP78_22475 [Salmonella enterica subsp. enterica]
MRQSRSGLTIEATHAAGRRVGRRSGRALGRRVSIADALRRAFLPGKQHTAGREDAALAEDAAEVSTTKLITLAAAGRPLIQTAQQTGCLSAPRNSTASPT